MSKEVIRRRRSGTHHHHKCSSVSSAQRSGTAVPHMLLIHNLLHPEEVMTRLHAMCSQPPPPLRPPHESSFPEFFPQGLQLEGLLSFGHRQLPRRYPRPRRVSSSRRSSSFKTAVANERKDKEVGCEDDLVEYNSSYERWRRGDTVQL